MNKSSLELAVLGLLKEGPMHGYELRKRLRMIGTVSFGALYPCLDRLRSAGHVEASDDESAPGRRRRTVYRVTAGGERFFFNQLEEGAVYDNDRFRLRFAFSRYLSRESRIGLLERRKLYLLERLDEWKDTLRSAEERMDSYARTLVEHGMEATEQDIRWLQDLIDAERKSEGAPEDGASQPVRRGARREARKPRTTRRETGASPGTGDSPPPGGLGT